MIFALCMTPLSDMLCTRAWFQSSHQMRALTHTLFTDDLKIFVESGSALAATVARAQKLAGDIGMELGLAKCAVAHLKGRNVKGKVTITHLHRSSQGAGA